MEKNKQFTDTSKDSENFDREFEEIMQGLSGKKIQKPQDLKETKTLWNAVREICKKFYRELENEDLRNGFYVVRRYLFNHYYFKKKLITQQAFLWFATEGNAYFYYTQDLWPQLERLGYARPEAHPTGFVYWNGKRYTPEELETGCSRARGFIYIEKDGIAKHLLELSKYGWGIVTAQGQSPRKTRELLRATGKPVLSFTDYDLAGEQIANAIKNKTKRTEHLNINVGELATHLALRDNQVDYLIENFNAPIEPIPFKDKKKWGKNFRMELATFTLIPSQTGKPSILEFIISLMKQKGYILAEEKISKERFYRAEMIIAFKKEISNIINKCREGKEFKGEAVDLELKEEIDISNILDNPKVIEAISKALEENEDKCKWITEKAMDKRIVGDIPTKWKIK